MCTFTTIHSLLHLCLIKLLSLSLSLSFTGPGVPAYLSKPTPESRNSPSKRRKVVQQRNEVKQEQWLDADRIPSYTAMTGSIVEHLRQTYPRITVLLQKNNVVLYCLHGHDDLDIAVDVSMTM